MSSQNGAMIPAEAGELDEGSATFWNSSPALVTVT